MSVTNSPEARTALIARIKGILLKPKEEWAKIDVEPATVQGLYTGYIVILAALPAICNLIGSTVFGYTIFGITYHPPLIGAVTTAIVQYVLQLVGVFILALIIDALAPMFGGQKNRIQALKLAAYSWTAAWLAGCFAIIPALSILSLLGIYSLYLLYTGLPVMTKAPSDKALPFTGAIIVAAIILTIVIGAIAGAIAPRPAPTAGPDGTLSGQLKLPGGGSLDLGALEKAADSLESAATQGQSGTTTGATPIAPDALKAILPGGLPGGYAQDEVSTGSGGAAGLSGSAAKAIYNKGDANITVTVTDLGALGAMAALGGAFGVNASEENATSYSKISNVNGRLTTEKYDKEKKSGMYSVMVSNRVMVEAAGTNTSMDDLKSAVGSVDLRRIESLVK